MDWAVIEALFGFFVCGRAQRGLTVGFVLLRYPVVYSVESLSHRLYLDLNLLDDTSIS